MTTKAKKLPAVTPDTTFRAVTSASNFFRRRLCIGSGHEEAKYGPEPDTEFSEEGKILHRYFLTNPIDWPDSLTTQQREVLSLANVYARNFIAEVERTEGIAEDEVWETDREVPLIFSHGGQELMPGHADFIRTYRERSLRIVIDAKFGVMEVDEAPDSDQLAIYACMADQKWPVDRTHVAIIQPRNFGPRMSSAEYGSIALARAADSIAEDFHRSQKGGPLTPGAKQCHFCRAKVKCEAYQQKFFAVYTPGERAIETLDNEQLVKVHEAISFANKIAKQVSEEMRNRVSDGRITTHVLQNSGDDRRVINPTGLFNAFASTFAGNPKWSAARYDECRDMSWGKLEDYVRELTGASSDKKAKETTARICEPFIFSMPKAKKVVRKKD